MEKFHINLNSIPEMIESKVLTQEDAAKIIAEDLIRNPKDYHLISNDEDIISELSLRILQSSDFIFKNYKKEKCSFKTYICMIFKYQILTIRRENKRQSSGYELVKQYPHLHYENQSELYEMDEAPFKIAHVKPFIKKTEDKITYKEKRKSKKEKKIMDTEEISAEKTKIKMRDLVSYWESRTSSKAKTALVLALKSSYYITEENIDSVCDYCEISKKIMQETIDELKSKIPEKHEKIEILQNRRAKSFNFHLKLQKWISEEVDIEKKNELSKKYEYYTKKWQERNSRIKTNNV